MTSRIIVVGAGIVGSSIAYHLTRRGAEVTLIDAGADAVIGSRYVTGGGTTDWPIRRQLLSRCGNAYTRTVLRLGARDLGAPGHDWLYGAGALHLPTLLASEPPAVGRWSAIRSLLEMRS